MGTLSGKGSLEKGLGGSARGSLGPGWHEVKSEVWLVEMLTKNSQEEKGKFNVNFLLISSLRNM